MQLRSIFFGLLLIVPATSAGAADVAAVIPVVFPAPSGGWETRNLVEGMREALSRTPSFNLMAVVTPDALVITVPDGIQKDGHEDKATFNFTAVFSRGGDKIGESLVSCKASAQTECITQFTSDATSAAGIVK